VQIDDQRYLQLKQRYNAAASVAAAGGAPIASPPSSGGAIGMRPNGRGPVAPTGSFKVASRKVRESAVELQADSTISWEFVLDKKDIGLSVEFEKVMQDGTQEVVEVIPYTKVFADGPRAAVKGVFIAQGPFKKGTITFKWDNSYSKMTAKAIEFKLDFR
jgi:hypothetical protein